MRRVFEYKTLWGLLLIITIYWCSTKLIPFTPRAAAYRGVFLVLSGWGLFAYWRPFRKTLFGRGWPTAPGLYAIMVWVMCASYNLNAGMGIFWRGAGQPAYLINNSIFEFWIVLAIIAQTISITVPDLFGKDVPPKEKIQMGSAWAIMFLIVVYIVVLQPDMRPFAEMVRPWLDSKHEYIDPD